MLDGDYSDSIRAAELQMVLITPVRRFRYSTANGSIACEAVVLCTIRATAPSALKGVLAVIVHCCTGLSSTCGHKVVYSLKVHNSMMS